jgi:plastocyanin
VSGSFAPGLKRGLAIGLGALLVGAPSLGCGGGSGSSTASAGPSAPLGTIEVGDFFFSPQSKHVSAGETVTWFNTSSQLHTVKGPGFSSQAFGRGESYRFHFTRPGTYKYLCTLHPTRMKGTIVVG